MKHGVNLSLIDPAKSLLLVIDLQDKFVPFLHNRTSVLQATTLLIKVAKELQVPIVVTEHNPKRIGATLPELMSQLEGVKVFSKDIFSCLGDENIKREILSHNNLKNIIIVGCETHICVMQTTLDALNLKFEVHVVANGVGSRKEIDWKLGLERLATAGAVISSSEMVSYELLKRSDTPTFKNLLPAFKEWINRAD